MQAGGSASDTRAAASEEILRCLIKLIEGDNKIFHFALSDPRIVIKRRRIVAPVPPEGTGWKKFFVKEDELTVPYFSVGRWETFYDYSGLPIWGGCPEDRP